MHYNKHKKLYWRLSMNFKPEHINHLRELHDKIKEHPFRLKLETKYCYSYKNMLYDLSEAWADIIYRTEGLTHDEEMKLYHFGNWIHNYRARLQMYYPHDFPETFLDYYEQMLQITHEFLDTGNLNVYYGIVRCINKNGDEVWVSERYEWTTSKDLGIESLILPRYLPKKYKLVEDDEIINKSINSGYNAVYETVEQRQKWFDFWQKETKPVLHELNKHNSDRYIHTNGASVIYKP